MAAFVGDDVKSSLDAMGQDPPYMIDNLIGAYLKGLGFVFEVQGTVAGRKSRSCIRARRPHRRRRCCIRRSGSRASCR